MEIGDFIYFLLVVVFGIISAFSKKKKKKPAFENKETENDFFEKYFKDPEEIIEEYINTPESEQEPIEIIQEAEPIKEVSLQEKYEELQQKRRKRIVVENPEDDLIANSIEEFDYNDSDIGNFKDNEENTQEELIDFDLREAVIYSEILKPKYQEN